MWTVKTDFILSVLSLQLKKKIQHSSHVLRALGSLAEVRDVIKVPEAVLVLPGEHAGLTWRRERRRLGGELFVEVADVFFVANGGNEGRRYFPLQQCLPVHVLEGEDEKRSG